MKVKMYPVWKKVFAFISVLLFGTLVICGIAEVIVAVDQGYYGRSKDDIVIEALRELALDDSQAAVGEVIMDNPPVQEGWTYMDFYDSKNVVKLVVTDTNGKETQVVNQENNRLVPDGYLHKLSFTVYADKNSHHVYYGIYNMADTEGASYEPYQVVIHVDGSFPYMDKYWTCCNLVWLCYNIRYFVYPILVLSLLFAIRGLVYLMKTAGYSDSQKTPRGFWETKIPLDIQTIIFAIVGACYCAGLDSLDSVSSEMPRMILAMLLIELIAALCLFYLISLVIRFRTKTIWTNTIIYRIGVAASNVYSSFMNRKGITFKITLAMGIATALELIVLMAAWDNDMPELLVLFLLVANAGLWAIGIRNAIKMAEVNDTKLNEAIEEKLKSERMKTELITNVSHDIKTPLTSIINYTDLIAKEDTDNEKIAEYTGVLKRQSEKLKRLIEDLVEASKAATGNLDVAMIECEANIFVEQAQGEYQEKLDKSGLTLITKAPLDKLKIQADGRRMWRVFDNLLNNICKYSLPGSRVYLSLEEIDGFAVFSFKNTSREPLDMKPEELMERFVRGDKSRNTEGNGLGLSIARSLTELQNGTINVSTDGDLFKVELRFPRCK